MCKFKGLEDKVILLIDILVNWITNELYKRLVYVGSSHTNTYLWLVFYDNVSNEDYKKMLNHLGVDEIYGASKAALLDTLGLDLLK